MSEPWVWENIDDKLDLTNVTDDDGTETQQYRHHIFVEATRLLTEAEAAAWTTKVGISATNISAFWGESSKTFTLAEGKFICVANNIKPEAKPGIYCREYFAAEFYSRWADIPESWGWESEPPIDSPGNIGEGGGGGE